MAGHGDRLDSVAVSETDSVAASGTPTYKVDEGVKDHVAVHVKVLGQRRRLMTHHKSAVG
ncbi:MAG TPA: hypothetical protein VFK02_29460 [Kofleriaceae bacterium]|nr:hypothetical protein [Kofleriaceae bacterium]